MNEFFRLPSSDSVSAAGATRTEEVHSSLWEVRTEERSYARLADAQVNERNRYGQKIDLVELVRESVPRSRSLYINENPEVGCNPNRNKQHAFFFNADNCIGCHACESACAEKNETPPHLAFRSVGYLEGGSYPDYKRLNISMACNHCDDPVCLKGCPTRAYTKHVEYGAVLQDPETCFGCGYCTWVCPYNAPQLDPVEGQVSKCNMCVDRLEVGLKPACVSACVGNALDFGIVENIPTGCEEAKTHIPGFPDPEITHPNIRFQQTKTLPDEMKRTDLQAVKYRKHQDGSYKPAVDRIKFSSGSWNLRRLNSRENPLVFFTLAAQAAIGAFAVCFVGARLDVVELRQFLQTGDCVLLLMSCLALLFIGLVFSTLHLGKPKRFYRGFNNLRWSPVSREGLGIALTMLWLALHTVLLLPANGVFVALWRRHFDTDISLLISANALALPTVITGYLALFSALSGLIFMTQCYRITARPFWNHPQVATAFFGSALSLGSSLLGIFLLLAGSDYLGALRIVAATMCVGTSIELLGIYWHARDLKDAEHEGAASYYVQRTTFGRTYQLRIALLGAVLLGSATLVFLDMAWLWIVGSWLMLTLALVAACLIGRCLFYVLVIPTTMPGAFFWRNKSFEEHARSIGLAEQSQVGVIPGAH